VVLDEPFTDAVIVAVSSASSTSAALAANVPVADPGGMVTDAGVVRAPLLDIATVAPPVVDTVTEQFAVTALLRVDGVQPTAVTTKAARSVMDVDWDDPFNDAVIVAG
jgi:hypothetical protein